MNLSKENLNNIHFDLLSRFNSYCWISGGCILDTLDGKTPRDIDIYFGSQREQEKAVSKAKVQGAKIIQQYPLGTKIEWDGVEVDLTFCGEDPEKVFDKYDYTILCIAIDKNGKFFHHPDFFEHYAERKLYYTGIAQSKGASHFSNKAKRLNKYIKKGYSIDEENLEFWLELLISEQKKPKKQKNKQSNSV
jgi:hypothetical protein|tara:strand:+ start:369 stop:941 length:573 start_codon:yes stop_codon:yes gene_type:complete